MLVSFTADAGSLICPCVQLRAAEHRLSKSRQRKCKFPSKQNWKKKRRRRKKKKKTVNAKNSELRMRDRTAVCFTCALGGRGRGAARFGMVRLRRRRGNAKRNRQEINGRQ